MHFGNGTAELLRGDPRAFFASVHMIYGDGNDGHDDKHDAGAGSGKAGIKADEEGAYGFYPSLLGTTEVTDNYVSVGVFPPHPVQPSKPERNYFGRNNAATTATVKSEYAPKGEKVDASDEKRKGGIVDRNRSTDSVDGAELDDSSRMDLSLDQPEECSSSPQPEECSSSPQPEECSSSPLPPRGNDNIDEGVDTNKVIVKSDSKSSASAGSRAGAGAIGSPMGEFRGAAGFRQALLDVIIPQMEKFNPQLLIISGTFVFDLLFFHSFITLFPFCLCFSLPCSFPKHLLFS